jgi:hypothetical protein
VDYKTPWIKNVGSGTLPKDDRFKYGSMERKMKEMSPGPTTALPNETILPKISTSISKFYFILKRYSRINVACGCLRLAKEPF